MMTLQKRMIPAADTTRTQMDPEFILWTNFLCKAAFAG